MSRSWRSISFRSGQGGFCNPVSLAGGPRAVPRLALQPLRRGEGRAAAVGVPLRGVRLPGPGQPVRPPRHEQEGEEEEAGLAAWREQSHQGRAQGDTGEEEHGWVR